MLVAAENDVRLWSRDPDVADAINREHRNPRYLSEVEIPKSVRCTSDLEEAVTGAELVICAVPSHGLREVMTRVAPHLSPDAIAIIVLLCRWPSASTSSNVLMSSFK